MIVCAVIIMALFQTSTQLPAIGDDKRVILYGVGAILTAMASAFALLWRAYQNQVDSRQADYKDVIVVLRAVESQGKDIEAQNKNVIEKLQSIHSLLQVILEAVNRKGLRN